MNSFTKVGDNKMDFFKKLENICEINDCYLEYVGENAPNEYKGFENSWLIFSNDATDGEYDLIIIKDSSNPHEFISEYSSEPNMSLSHKAVLAQISEWVAIQEKFN